MPGETFLSPPSKIRAFVLRAGTASSRGSRKARDGGTPPRRRANRAGRPVAAPRPRRGAPGAAREYTRRHARRLGQLLHADRDGGRRRGATCDRKHVGALLVRDRIILSTGYNGSIRGMPHCDEVGHMMEDGHCVATIHAEANAILQAARNGVADRGRRHLHDRQPLLALLQDRSPTPGIKRIVFGEFYRDERIFDVARRKRASTLVDLSSGRPAIGPEERKADA